MPKPPDLGAFDDIKFITNYMLAGCEPPFWLFVEFSQEPAKDLGLILLVPEVEDIAQAIFDPHGGRRRKPARHGRKRRRRLGFPSADDIIGQRLRGRLNPGNVLNIGLFRRAFPILNIVEGFNFSAAVIEGVTDIGYEALWGILQADTQHCKEFSRLSKSSEVFQTVGGGGPPLQPVNIQTVDFNSGYSNTFTSAKNRNHKCTTNFNAYVRNNRSDVTASGTIALQNTDTGQMHRGQEFILGPGEGKFLQVDAEFGADEWFAWGFADMQFFVDVYQRNILSFRNVDMPWG